MKILNTSIIILSLLIVLEIIDFFGPTNILNSIPHSIRIPLLYMPIVILIIFSLIKMFKSSPTNNNSIEVSGVLKKERNIYTTIGIFTLTTAIHAMYFLFGSFCGFGDSSDCTFVMSSIAIGFIISLGASWHLSGTHNKFSGLLLYILANASAIGIVFLLSFITGRSL